MERSFSNGLAIGLFLIAVNSLYFRGVFSPVRDLANEDMVLIAMSGLFFFVFASLRSGGRWLLSSLMVLTVIHVVAACLQKLGMLPTHSTGRVSGLFWHYNYYADFVGVGILAFITPPTKSA